MILFGSFYFDGQPQRGLTLETGGGVTIGGLIGKTGVPPGPPMVGPTGPWPGKSNGLGIAATSAAGAFESFALGEAGADSPRLGSSLARTAWTAPSASGATATAHCETKRICSGAAVAAAWTIAATVCVLAFEPSMAALTISHAQAGAAETSLVTISRTFD